MKNGYYFRPRLAAPDAPAGITVTKNEKLPDGDFELTEYCWGGVSLWFLNSDKFTADERQEAYRAYTMNLMNFAKS